MPADTDDIAVIRMVLQGSQAAYATLVSRYQSYVFTLAMRYVNNRELAEELSQDVFVKAYRYLADFKMESKFSTWLYTIVHTTCLSQLRKKKDETLSLDKEDVRYAAEQQTAEHAINKLERKTEKQLIDQAIQQLPEQDAEVITLFYQGEQTLEEIGTILGQTPNNVKVRLFRARQKLREIMERSYKKELT